MGFTEAEFGRMNPRLLKPHIKAQKLRNEVDDERMWAMGAYVYRAVQAGVDGVLNGRKARAKYPEKPFHEEGGNVSGEDMTERDKIEKTKKLFNALNIMKVNFDLKKSEEAE